MGRKLYVGNLEWSVSDNDLLECFKPAGEVVSASVILVRDTGRSRGFGFVEMATEEEAAKAMKTLNDTMLNNRPLIVREAKPEGTNKNDSKGKLDKINKFMYNARPGEKMDIFSGKKHFTITCDDDMVESASGEAEIPVSYR